MTVLTSAHYGEMLKDMLVTYLHRMEIHALRNDPGKHFFDLKGCDGPDSAEAVERNYMFVLELCATMAGAPSLPVHSIFKACFYELAITYGLFGPGTRKKTIKDWASETGGHARALGMHALHLYTRASSSRSWQIRLVKRCINDALAEVTRPDSEQSLVELAQQQLENTESQDVSPSSVNTSGSDSALCSSQVKTTCCASTVVEEKDPTTPVKPAKTKVENPGHLDRYAAQRQANKERQPMFAAGIQLDAGLEKQVESLMSMSASAGADADADLVKAQNKVLKALKQNKRSADDDEPEGDKPAKRGRAKGKAKAKAKPAAGAGETSKDVKDDATSRPAHAGAKDGDDAAQQVEGDQVGEGDQDGEGKQVDGDQPEGDKPTRGRKARDPKPKVSLEELEIAWKEKEPLLKEAGIPIPDGYVPKTKSYTLPSPSDKGYSMQILWFSNQIYCNQIVTVEPGFRQNGKSGVTISIVKHGGWKVCFPKASKMAGWD